MFSCFKCDRTGFKYNFLFILHVISCILNAYEQLLFHIFDRVYFLEQPLRGRKEITGARYPKSAIQPSMCLFVLYFYLAHYSAIKKQTYIAKLKVVNVPRKHNRVDCNPFYLHRLCVCVCQIVASRLCENRSLNDVDIFSSFLCSGIYLT